MIELSYGHTPVGFDPAGAAILVSRADELKSEKNGRDIVRQALDNPIASKPLKELARGKKSCTIIISDHTRPVPSKDIIPEMLKDLRDGNPDIDICLLAATGFHRLSTEAELRAKLGDEVYENEKVYVHDSSDPQSNIKIGILPSGAPLIIDKRAVETDLLVAEGFIEPHFFAGFSGGRKSVLPGMCDRVTVLGNHCGSFIDSPYARTGVLEGNPIHKDMVAAVEIAKLAFIVNVVIDDDKKTVAAFAGDCIKAHEKGCEFLRGYCEIKTDPYDIVITTNGGAPLDQNIYQCVKSMTAAEAAAGRSGVIIEVAECADGTGGDGFYNSLKNCSSAAEFYDECKNTPQDKTIPDQWESQILARILKDHAVIFVTRPELKTTIEEMKMTYADSVENALKLAKQIKGEDASLAVIPNGISVIVTPNNR